jgi:Regulator of ribonuclease activity B
VKSLAILRAGEAAKPSGARFRFSTDPERLMKFPNDANGAVLQSMVDAGMDLTQEYEIEFCHLFPDEESALAMERRMQKMKINCDLYNNAELMEDAEEDEFGEIDESLAEGFDVICLVNMVPTHAEVTQMEQKLGDIARECGGEPDGWGVMQPDDGEL